MTTKQEATKLKNKALRLFLEGKGGTTIINETGISSQTLQRWKVAGEWDLLYKKNQTIIKEDLNIDIAKEKEEDLKVFEAIKQIYKVELNKEIQNKETAQLPKNTDTFSRAMKTKWEILMPKTISQYNFMKQENQIGPAYTLEIIKPDVIKNGTGGGDYAHPNDLETIRETTASL